VSDYVGIDYGLGQSNIDRDTGIRFGVINQNEVLQAWADSSEADYGNPHCPKCGNEAVSIENECVPDLDSDECPAEWEDEARDHACLSCQYSFASDDAYGDEPNGFTYDGDGYVCTQYGGDGDIFVLKSPYYTHAQFCSPCAPGAGYLMNPVEGGPKTYCFGHDWFEGDKAPYPVYSVATGELVEAE
jgi:ribosomal protein L37AE/L43A